MELSMRKGFNFRSALLAFSMAFMCLFSGVATVVSMPVEVLAVSEETAMHNLTTYVYGKMSQTEYSLAAGGSLKGSELFSGSPTKGYDLDENKFTQLSSKAQSQVVSDIAKYSNEAAESDKAKGVEESTVQTWWKQLQTKNGVGSKFMNEILKNTKPDFVSANAIYQPFAGPVGIVLGLLSIVIVAFLGVVMATDIAYITLPPLRMFITEGEGQGQKFVKSNIISNDAIKAVQWAEESDAQSASGKQALGFYFKRRVFSLVILGICLLYLVQGQLYTFVGYILDIVSGFLGF